MEVEETERRASLSGGPSRSTQLARLYKAVVVLTRLPDYKISALRPPTPGPFYSEDESLSSSDSDMQWEPGDSSDSDYRLSGKSKAAAQSSRRTDASKQKTGKPTKSETRTPAAAQSSSRGSGGGGDVSPPAPAGPSAPAHSSDKTKVVRPDLPEEEIKVDMMVLAKRKPMRYQRGKIVDIITRENGRLKYKVCFEEKGKSLVSGHHIAFDNTPKLEQLYVGARVLVRSQDNKFWFQPAILAELPNRKNRLRFMVFLDDHTPIYVGLPFLRLVSRPLENVLDDIPDTTHRCFMNQYLKDWPYPPLYQYKAGQSVNVELNGVQQRCQVLVVDCSLIQVVFQDKQQKEWIYRGSIRLEHMARFMELKEIEHEDDSD